MEIINRKLPSSCYNNNYLINHKYIVQHYFSGKNVSDDKYNIDICWNLMRDLNFEKEHRIYDLYNGPRLYASAHYFIGRGGEVICLVDDKYKAYHAGKSKYNDDYNLNNMSIGIENINAHGDNYTYEQYESNSDLCVYLIKKYGIKIENILGHEDIAIPLGRKKDPGEKFDWDLLKTLIEEKL